MIFAAESKKRFCGELKRDVFIASSMTLCLPQTVAFIVTCLFFACFLRKTLFWAFGWNHLDWFWVETMFFLKKESLSYLSKQPLIYKFDCERLGQQSTCCFKEMKTFNRWLSDQPPCHFHCRSNVTF